MSNDSDSSWNPFSDDEPEFEALYEKEFKLQYGRNRFMWRENLHDENHDKESSVDENTDDSDFDDASHTGIDVECSSSGSSWASDSSDGDFEEKYRVPRFYIDLNCRASSESEEEHHVAPKVKVAQNNPFRNAVSTHGAVKKIKKEININDISEAEYNSKPILRFRDGTPIFRHPKYFEI